MILSATLSAVLSAILVVPASIGNRVSHKAEVCKNFDLSALVALSNCLILSMVLTIQPSDRSSTLVKPLSLQFHPLLNIILFIFICSIIPIRFPNQFIR